jgi:hypothetical protein
MTLPRLTTGVCVFILLASLALGSDRKASELPTLRWGEDQRGCTFERGDDGKYRYGLWKDDIGVIVAVDSQELQMTRRRLEPMFGVSITVRYRGHANTYVNINTMTLEFVDHHEVVRPSLDPDNLASVLQNDAETLEDEAQREGRKHPEKLAAKQQQIEEYQKQVLVLQNFLVARSLRSGTLDPETPETSGWVFFSTRNKWIGDWKKQERLVLRIPMPAQVLEFPITLPPSEGELLLRKRP